MNDVERKNSDRELLWWDAARLRRNYASNTVDKTLERLVADQVEAAMSDLGGHVIAVIGVESTLPYHLKQLPTPREVGVVSFTLDRGVYDKQHYFLEPPDIPLGYMHQATYHSDNHHRIPPTESPAETTSIRELFTRISRVLPGNFVYTSDTDVSYIQDVLSLLMLRSGETNSIKVLPIGLFINGVLKRLDERVLGFKELQNVLHPSYLQCMTDICCEYHFDVDCPRCALGNSIRLAVATHSILLANTGDTNTRDYRDTTRDYRNSPILKQIPKTSSACHSTCSSTAPSRALPRDTSRVLPGYHAPIKGKQSNTCITGSPLRNVKSLRYPERNVLLRDSLPQTNCVKIGRGYISSVIEQYSLEHHLAS